MYILKFTYDWEKNSSYATQRKTWHFEHSWIKEKKQKKPKKTNQQKTNKQTNKTKQNKTPQNQLSYYSEHIKYK